MLKRISKEIGVTALFASLVFTFAVTARAQNDSVFSDPNVEYSFDVPDPRWKMTAKPSVTNPNVEFVFIDRLEGHLEVRKLNVAQNVLVSDVIREEEQKLQFLPGYVAGREENFGGKLNGAIFNYEYVRAGRPMAGRFYFLRSGGNVYVLRFTGFRDKLRSIRTQTDIIARTFGVK
ncbi:MAG: hypothetical protein IPM21_03345 [Acidobacteria bacterium]|nr:hypothetical protein [Acidobacteriota bacterium]